MTCTKCHTSMKELFLLGLLKDLGCSVSGVVERCLDGDAHNFHLAANVIRTAPLVGKPKEER